MAGHSFNGKLLASPLMHISPKSQAIAIAGGLSRLVTGVKKLHLVTSMTRS